MRYTSNKISDKWYVSTDHISISLPSLNLTPKTFNTSEIVKRFNNGNSLSPDQMQYLDNHRFKDNNPTFDPILDYYLKHDSSYNKTHEKYSSIFLSHQILNKKNISLLKKRINEMIKNDENQQADIQLTEKQYSEFKHYTTQELIYWHGNHFLTGAPFYPNSTPSVIHFQWGNYYGIVRYHAIPGERSGSGNYLLTFEKRKERDLAQCVADYQQHLQEKPIDFKHAVKVDTVSPKNKL